MKTRLTLKPGQEGTKRLVEKYGASLVCVRFRYDKKRGKRLKTVELIEEETDWAPPGPRFPMTALVPLRIPASDMRLRALAKAAGSKWNPEKKLWFVRYGAISNGPLESHIHVDKPDKWADSDNHIHIDGE